MWKTIHTMDGMDGDWSLNIREVWDLISNYDMLNDNHPMGRKILGETVDDRLVEYMMVTSSLELSWGKL